MKPVTYDIVIVGAGPAGCSCAYKLKNSNLKVALLDKATFPRDKVCGDALSADVINQLHLMDDHLAKKFDEFQEKYSSNGIRFFAPNGAHLDIEFLNKTYQKSAGYISKRVDFDSFLFNQVKNSGHIDVFENHKVIDIKAEKENITILSSKTRFEAKMVIGADGANSILNRTLTNNQLLKKHHCAGLRQYYKNVTGFKENGSIELHFYKDILPGYFWVFPLPNNQANVGLGMLSSEVSKKGINLKKKLQQLIRSHPNLKDRFNYAEPIETIQGFGLPIGSRKKQLSGNRFLLLGDAANLIDPFTGEGIGNAVRSGRVAADHLIRAFKKQKFDSNFNKMYDNEIYRRMWPELRIGRTLQNLLRYPKLFNFLVMKANKNESLRLLLSSMLDDVNIKNELTKTSFYFKLLFK